ncbi:MAG: bifunctional alpha,alpha-trehalose-phosphate synthase (UDP-forming)/trehalose-phosphatase, partial [Tannerellaceae bacterium]|nr:bifunctional alpha,alpha-trehalose-phosphate synthase (UDP-forming)/trehalose-phosphatase [Tannerellaceae bacterium]
MKLIIISNRLPLKIVEEDNQYKVVASDGGLATGLNSLQTLHERHWIGWPGMYLEDGEEKQQIDAEMLKQNFHPVYLTPEQIENYYEGYSNSVLWPLCHYFSTYMRYEPVYWDAYKEVNKLFCDEACRIIEPGDIVWVHDYQLMLLPAMIRECVRDISIGYFLHIPFPSYELFRSLPERADLLNGLLGADLVGFHTHSYMRHFISAVYRVLKYDCTLDEIQLDSRVVDVDAFPMGINYRLYYDSSLKPAIKKQIRELKSNFGEGKIILSVDRLDYSKGILIRLDSYRQFLEHHPEWHGKVSLVMIVSPSRDKVEMYAELKDQIDQMVGSLNGKYSSSQWTPVHYFYRGFDFEEVTAIYHIADVALVTPLRDGMNLVAKEYLAAKRNKPGVLILSEMAGASNELYDAIIVNPTDIKQVENAILEALKMPVAEQKKHLKAMQEIISVQTVQQWAADFIEELGEVYKKNKNLQEKIIRTTQLKGIKKQYETATKRLILLDYDGTLVPFYRNPLQAKPSKALLGLLAHYAADPSNKVVITSGRDFSILEKWFGDLPVDMAAEHGAFYKEGGQWHEKVKEVEWDKDII